MKALKILTAIALAAFVAYRTLIGGATTSWHQRLTVVVQTPAGEVQGASVTEITKTETMGLLVLPEASGVHGKVRGEAVALEVLPGRWLFALLSGDADGKGEAGQLVYHAFRLGKGRPAIDRSYQSNMADLRAQPLDTPAPCPWTPIPCWSLSTTSPNPKPCAKWTRQICQPFSGRGWR